MQKVLTFLVVAIGISTAVSGQTRLPKNSEVEAQIAAIEQAGWSAWKNKDKRWFQENTTAEVVWINSDGITNKSQFLKDLSTDCVVNSFTFSDYKVTTTTNEMAIMTYTATQDAVCSGKKLPEKIRASVVYVRRNGKWLEAFYMETPQAK